MSTLTSKKLFTVNDYALMAKTGILSESDRVELIRGEVQTMSPIGSRHGAAVDHANRVLGRLAGDRAIVRVQGSIVLDMFDQPQPDIALLKPKDDFYATKNPGASDVLLLIEVSDTSLDYDKTVKLTLYAEMGIPEYWIADLQNDCLLAYSKPHGLAYEISRKLGRNEQLAPQLLPDCIVNVSVLLP